MNDFLPFFALASVILIVVGWIWSCVVARKVNTLWFAGISLAFVFVAPLFAIKHWSLAKKPFLVSVAGYVLLFVSFALLPDKTA